MRLRHFALLFLMAVVGTCTVLAAPAPKPQPWVRGWDRPVNPRRDCKFVRDGKVMTIEIPAGKHDLAPDQGAWDAPRLLRDVVGDFVAEVRVEGRFPTAEPAKASAGLMLLTADNALQCVHCASCIQEGSNEVYFRSDLWDSDPHPGHGSTEVKIPGKTVISLRLERKGNKLYSAFRQDNKRWLNGEETELKMPARVKLGVFAASTSARPFKARFDQFKLSQKKP